MSAFLLLLLASGASAAKLPADRAYTGDLILSIPLLPGWEYRPHDLDHMNDNPKDLWISNERTGGELRINHTEKAWAELLVLQGKRPGAEIYKTETGISVILALKEWDAKGAFECFGSRYEFKASGMTYPELRQMFERMACRTVKEEKKPRRKRAPKRASEPSL